MSVHQFDEHNSYRASEKFRYSWASGDGDSNRHQLKRSRVEKSSPSSRRDLASIGHFLRNVFLPEGYPDSVSDDYLPYQCWDTAQAFASSISGSLAAQAVLQVPMYARWKSIRSQ